MEQKIKQMVDRLVGDAFIEASKLNDMVQLYYRHINSKKALKVKNIRDLGDYSIISGIWVDITNDIPITENNGEIKIPHDMMYMWCILKTRAYPSLKRQWTRLK